MAFEEITVVQGVAREVVKSARAGDIVSISVTGFMPRWTQSLVSHPKVPPVDCQAIDPPILAVRCGVNDSPLAGKDGKRHGMGKGAPQTTYDLYRSYMCLGHI